MSSMSSLRGKLRLFDWALATVPLILLLFGIVIIYTVTFPTVSFALAQSQIIYATLGVIIGFTLTLIDYRTWRSLAPLAYTVGLTLLILVFFIGSRQFGASRWLDLGSFSLQPSEVFKLILILSMARLLALWQGEITIRRLVFILLIAVLPIALVLQQPDLGTAGVLVAITFGMLLYAKIPLKWWLVMGLIAALLLPVGYTQLRDYQKERVKTFLSPDADLAGQGYNVRQATIAIGSGGLVGQGLGRGSQSQLNFLPVAHTDFIFAGLAEATGLLGGMILLILYGVLISRILRVGEVSKDHFGMYLSLGIAVMFGFQIFVNIGMNLGLLPVTGIPLPLVSFGGTSLIVSLASLGILQSVYVRHRKITF